MEYPRRFKNSMAWCPPFKHASSLESSREEKMPLLPSKNSARMSAMDTVGNGRPPTRCFSSMSR